MKKMLVALSLCLPMLAAADHHPNKTFTVNDTLYLHSDTFANMDVLLPYVNNYDVFINGENHTYLRSNAMLWVKMIKFLHQKAGVKNVMIEYGYSSGWLINRYIQTGDSSLFEVLKNYSFKDLAYAYRSLMEYNATLPAGNKLQFTGIDLERGIYSAAKVLGLLLPKDKDVPDSIELHIESLQSLITYNDNKIFSEGSDFEDYFSSYSSNSTIDRIVENFNRHTAIYKNYLGENFTDFQLIIKGLQEVKTWNEYENDNATHQFVFREKYMYNNFLKLYREQGGKYFGQFGRCHSATSVQEENSCNWYNFKSLAHRIQSSKEANLKDKVFSMGILYNESFEDEGWAGLQDHLDSIFADLPENSISLFNLKADTLLHYKLQDMFNLICFNTFEPSRNYIYGRDDEDDDESTENVPKSNAYFSVQSGVYNFNLKSLNDWFAPLKQNLFNSPMTFIGFGISTDSKKVNNLMSFNFLLNQKRELNDSMDVRLGGFAFHSQSGINLLKNSRHFSLSPMWGLGFSNIRMEIEQSSTVYNAASAYLGESRLISYYNPAFTADVSLHTAVKIKKMGLGLWGGYQFDLSNKKWIAKQRMKRGPETSLRTWYAGLQLLFYILD